MQKKIIVFLVISTVFFGCTKGADTKEYDVAVFVPGVVDGSPTYEMMVQGVQKAVSENTNASIKVIEGGFNQGEWQEKTTSLAASGQFELIVSSNPAMPEICEAVSESYPDQKFLLLDGYLEGNTNIHTFRYNQTEQAFLSGYFGAMVSSSGMPGTEDGIKLGLIAGQEYPDMNLSILPGFKKGAEYKNNSTEVDFRVIGNWYDAAKASELANSMFDRGVDVILAICGGAAQGIIKAASDRNKYVLWFDSNGYSIYPGVIIGSTGLAQTDLAYEKTRAAINGKLKFGEAEFEGIAEKRVFFIMDDPVFTEYISKQMIEEITSVQQKFLDGELGFPMK